MAKVYFLKDTVSISLPAQIIVIALSTVAMEYKLPNSVLVSSKVSLKSWLNNEIKNVYQIQMQKLSKIQRIKDLNFCK